MPDLLKLSASEQARHVASGTVTAEELLTRQRRAIATDNPGLNAFVHVIGDGQPAAGISSLAGSTFAVKDNIDVQGIASHSGLRALRAQPAASSATVVARLETAGLTCLGKLNMHAMALGATNHNADFGDCYNPVRRTHTPGGSSGGAGAAVSGGLCGVALATDTMGSVRVPASYCGVVGFKPSFDALPIDGVMPLARLLDHVGVLARSVEDVRNAFAILGPRIPMRISPPALPTEAAHYELGVPASITELGTEPEVTAAFNAALRRVGERGWRLRPLAIPAAQLSSARRAGLLLSEAELRLTLESVLEERREEVPSDLLAMLDYAAGRSALDLARALTRMAEMAQWVIRTLETVDALLLPTTPQTAFPMDGPVPANQADFTALANLAGAPAISLPMPVPVGGLPVGLQVVSRRGLDMALLHVAGLLESAFSEAS